MANLLTNHDPYHIHALVGLLALLHFAYRYYLNARDVPNSGFGVSLWKDCVGMILFLLPNVTSFLFASVPVLKKGTDGFTIWKEFRWHALIFAARIWILMAMLLVELHTGQPLPHMWQLRVGVEFAAMLAAQQATAMYPPQPSSIRGGYSNYPWIVGVAGFLVMASRAAAIYGGVDPRDELSQGWMGIFIIQFNAFNLTLRKKRKIGPHISQIIYACLLASGFWLFGLRRLLEFPLTGAFDPRTKVFYTALLAYYIRRVLGFDRFSTWIVTILLMNAATEQFNLFDEYPEGMKQFLHEVQTTTTTTM